MIRVLSVFGTRPEAIKMAPVVKLLEEDPDFKSLVCVSAQHRDMLDQALGMFDIKPDSDLNLMRPGQNLHDLSARIISGLRPVYEDLKPDVVLVHGDTATTLCATLAAFYSRIPVGHVEAGLRTGELTAPFPEEGNRVLADRLCRFHFAPTEKSAENLLREGVDPAGVSVTGNTVIDALLWIRDRLPPLENAEKTYGSAAPLLAQKKVPLILVTGHRRESFGLGFERICLALKRLALENPGAHIVYPVHLNPNVQAPVKRLLSGLKNIHLISPLSYTDFVRLMNRSDIILTDSGGIQEEAPSLKKPTLVMREKTERPEGVAAGVVKLVGTDTEKIVAETTRLLKDPTAVHEMTRAENPYGDGRAAWRIANILRGAFS